MYLEPIPAEELDAAEGVLEESRHVLRGQLFDDPGSQDSRDAARGLATILYHRSQAAGIRRGIEMVAIYPDDPHVRILTIAIYRSDFDRAEPIIATLMQRLREAELDHGMPMGRDRAINLLVEFASNHIRAALEIAKVTRTEPSQHVADLELACQAMLMEVPNENMPPAQRVPVGAAPRKVTGDDDREYPPMVFIGGMAGTRLYADEVAGIRIDKATIYDGEGIRIGEVPMEIVTAHDPHTLIAAILAGNKRSIMAGMEAEAAWHAKVAQKAAEESADDSCLREDGE